jgi:hypothetical protein
MIKPRLYGAIGYKPYFDYTYLALDYFLRIYNKQKFTPLNYYEFGTGKGGSLIEFLKSLRRLLKVSLYEKIALETGINIVLFDSFEGLPDPKSTRDVTPFHSKGSYALSEENIRKLVNDYSRHINPKPQIMVVKGYYEDTLTESLNEKFKAFPPSFVNVDVDYYSSATTVLNFIAPICQNGTVFYFNNIFEHLGNLNKGEYAAISEFNNNNKIYHLFPYRIFTISEYVNRVFTMHKLNVNEHA